MSIIDFIKNPAKFIWGESDKKVETEQNNTFEVTDIKDNKKFSLENIKKLDWGWLFRDKTGLFIKIAIPTIIVLLIIQPFFTPKTNKELEKPPVVDEGDLLEKPPFEKVGYTTASLGSEKFLLYLPVTKEVQKIGIRGIPLDTYETSTIVSDFLYPINNEEYIYFKDNTLISNYLSITKVKDSYGDLVDKEELKEITFLNDINSVKELVNFHKTADNLIAYQYKDAFYVKNLDSSLVKSILTKDGFLFTYFSDEVYFIREKNNHYYLVKLNKNNEEILNILLGSNKPHKLSVINSERFLIVYEQPTDESFFTVEMKDNNGKVLFNFKPNEEVQKLTKIDYLVFDSNDNVVLFLGDNIAKLFNLNGDQLWIR